MTDQSPSPNPIRHPSDLVVQRIDELMSEKNGEPLNTRAGLRLTLSAFREGLLLMSEVERRQSIVEQAFVRFTNIESEVRKEIEVLQREIAEEIASIRGAVTNLSSSTDEDVISIQKDIKDLSNNLNSILPAYRVIMWAGGILGASLLLLLWAIFTGQAAIVFNP